MDQSQCVHPAWLNRSQSENTSNVDLAWPQLSSQNQMKHTMHKNVERCRYDSNWSTLVKFYTEGSLDDSEYPKLGQRKAKIKNTLDQFISDNKSVVAETKITCAKDKVRRKTFLREHRNRKSELFFDLSKALENAECFINGNRKESDKLKFNVCKVSASGSITNRSNNKNDLLRKKKLFNITLKKQSKLKRTIIGERRNNMKMKHQADDNAYKIKEKFVNANNINLNSLKIQSDPKVDINYVKHMSTLNVYDTNYRDSVVDNISEDTVQYRPDLTQKLNELRISNVQDKNIFISPYRNSVDTNNLNGLLNLNLSITDKNNVDIEPNINHLFDDKYSKNFKEYCNNLVTSSLNESLDKFLSEIRRLQDKLYNRNENKGKYKRRYYSGLKEVGKQIRLKKVRFVVIAPDIEKILSAGGLNEQVEKLLEICRKNETVFCFGLRRRKLGYYAHGNGFVSCIGISNYANAEGLFWNVLVEIIKARNAFEKLHGRSNKMINVSKITQEDGLLMDNIEVLLKSLTSII
ncbi:hypothetical protein M0802_009344 [Mischocyttarus mexicanus]|nr:hypothetical protein M0802_009344 [Mischocyttarus mexicanus]